MKYEIIVMPRQYGKSRFLAEKVIELQDAGHDPVVVIVPDATWVNHWFEMLSEFDIDPSRLVIQPVKMRRTIPRSAAYLMDDADLIPDWRAVVEEVRPYNTSDVITVTMTGDPE